MGASLRQLTGRIARGLLRPWAVVAQFKEVSSQLREIERQLSRVREALGRVEARQLGHSAGTGLQAHEFRVFSQWGEDGIVDWLVSRVPIERPVFVEFGVESYHEANTRFLLVHRNWAGLVMDGDAAQIARLRNRREYWLHNLRAVQAFVTRENINQLLREQGIGGPIGLLSIDIDGMDYWVWEAIDVIEPAIVVIEYNYRFGPDEAVTVPYRADFDRWKAHHSILYYGASLKALWQLGNRKGYALVGCGRAGLNAFFVRRELKPDDIPELSPEEAYVEAQFDEAHDAEGRRHRMTREEERRLVFGMPLVRVAE